MKFARLLRPALLFVGGSLFLPLMLAQQGTQPGGAGNGGTNDSRSDPSKAPGRQPQPRQNQQFPKIIFISGMVVSEDGSPLPSGVIIERSCGGQVWRETSVEPNGHFNFQVGGNRTSNLLPDASDSSLNGMDVRNGGYARMPGQMSDADPISSLGGLVGCELHARASGYRSSGVMLEANSGIGLMDVGTIVLYPISRVQGTLVSATNLQAPKPAQKALERSKKAVEKHNSAQAESELKSAIEIYPNYAAAWFELGQLYQNQQRYEDARTAYKKAIAIDSMYVSPYIQLAVLAAMEGHWQEVADLTDRAVALDPLDFPHGFFLNALAHWNLNNLEIAERSARRAERLDGRHRIVQLFLLLANILDRKHDVPGTMEQLRGYLKFAPAGSATQQVRARLQELEKSSEQRASDKPTADR